MLASSPPKTRHAAYALGTEWVYISDKLGFLPSFEGLRGLAILLVVYHHCSAFTPVGCTIGRDGVSIFFVLSGFLITGVLKTLFAESRSLVFALRRFYMDRFVRLSPPIVMASLYGFYMSYTQGEDIKRMAVWATRIATYTVNIEHEGFSRLLPFGPSKTAIWFDHLWSLCIEEQFYIIYSLALAAFLRYNLRAWTIWAAFLYSQYVAFRLSYWPTSFYDFHPKFSLVSALFKMLMGCLLRLTPLPAPLFKWYYGGSLAMLFFGVAHMITIFTTEADPEALANALVSYGTAVWIPSLITTGNWLLETSILRFVGRVSYSLYVYHFIQMTFDNTRFGHLRGYETVALAFLVATVSTLYIEEPLCRAYRKWSRRNDIVQEVPTMSSTDGHCYVSIPNADVTTPGELDLDAECTFDQLEKSESSQHARKRSVPAVTVSDTPPCTPLQIMSSP